MLFYSQYIYKHSKYKTCWVKSITAHSVHSPFLLGGWTSRQIFKRGGGAGLAGPQLWEEVAEKEGVTFFRMGCNFTHKKKLKSEIFNDKKVYKQKYFSVTIKNSNWEILTTNLVTFKR